MKIGILWDLDGTLLNTLEDLTDAVNYALARFGCPPRTMEEVRTFIGNGAAKLIRRSLPGKADDPDPEQVLAVYQTYYNAHSQVKTAPYPGVEAALKVLTGKYPMAIVSNKPDAAVKPLCKAWFGDIFARGESTDCPRKPAPDMVVKAMEAIGVETCVYVGDSEVDVRTAKNAGVPCLSVLWGFRGEEELRSAGAEHFCSDPADLPETLERMIQSF